MTQHLIKSGFRSGPSGAALLPGEIAGRLKPHDQISDREKSNAPKPIYQRVNKKHIHLPQPALEHKCRLIEWAVLKIIDGHLGFMQADADELTRQRRFFLKCDTNLKFRNIKVVMGPKMAAETTKEFFALSHHHAAIIINEISQSRLYSPITQTWPKSAALRKTDPKTARHVGGGAAFRRQFQNRPRFTRHSGVALCKMYNLTATKLQTDVNTGAVSLSRRPLTAFLRDTNSKRWQKCKSQSSLGSTVRVVGASRMAFITQLALAPPAHKLRHGEKLPVIAGAIHAEIFFSTRISFRFLQISSRNYAIVRYTRAVIGFCDLCEESTLR
ncbi:hypothetical protein TcasGA2_TC012648 [Tribolium castaneum]|uniref:Uncharacterized protein n=1 Tax=Tribolium castaneum TaxID=7070 RepID=D6WZD1_TRICA|nr:hypothetical protein TcasGA2_TC012648 [Tribolium castaneum]